MTDFVMNPKVGANPRPDITETVILDAAGNKTHISQNDLGKAVKLGADSAYQICSDGDEMEGFIVAVETFTVNGGHGFGAVQRNQRTHAIINVENPLIGTYVVAAEQAKANALNTREVTGQTRHMPLVKAAPTAAKADPKAGDPAPPAPPAPLTFKWRIVAFIRTAGAGKAIVTIERV